ncbi:hypothetical protein [Novosphingobium aromaticivorans]|uniref:hypothetical protein n=1 Tax=Novosphingobium aromaticivorans TaxID=48935 RepID=UPI0012EE95D7|nr:hypothetical protein [Novosphingobium aromaticivorans]
MIDDLRACASAGIWHAALALALSVPDICGGYDAPNAGSRARFVNWWNRHMAQKLVPTGARPLDARDIYALRCAMLHEGKGNIERQRARVAVAEFAFIRPPDGLVMHYNTFNNQLVLQVDLFCEQICRGAEEWLAIPGNARKVEAEPMMQVFDMRKGGFFRF